MTYSYTEDHGGGHHSNHRTTVNRSLTVQAIATVAEAEPKLTPWVGKWLSLQWAGRKDEVKICNRVVRLVDEDYVQVERKPPQTGGVIAARTLLASIPEPMALAIRPSMAIVVYQRKDHFTVA